MNFSLLRQILDKARIPLLACLVPTGAESFLVGGALRDWQLNRPISDLDFAFSCDPTEVSRKFAAAISGHWFMLDPDRRQSRVVVRSVGDSSFTYDFAPFRADDLIADLRLRDFTINAMALRISGGDDQDCLVDPLRGAEHLRRGLLQGCSPGVFQDDPLRILKGARHAAALGFSVEPATQERMREAAGLLSEVAAERIRSELAGIFAVDGSSRGLDLLCELDLLGPLFAPGREGGHFHDGLDSLARADQVLARLPSLDPGEWLDSELEAGLSHRTLLKMTAFLFGFMPSHESGFFENWRFSRRTARLGGSLVGNSPRRLEEIPFLHTTQRGRALWAASLGMSPFDQLVFLAILAKTPPEQAVEEVIPLLHDVGSVVQGSRIPDLVDGDWIRNELQVKGEAVGRALLALRNAEISGDVKSCEDAKRFLLRNFRRAE